MTRKPPRRVRRMDQPMSRAIDDTMIFEHVSDAVIATDLQLRILRWNNGATMLYGWASAEVVGCPFGEVVETVRYLDGGTSEQALEQLQRTGVWRSEVVQRRRDGGEIAVDASIRMLYDEQGQAVGIVALNRSIDERRSLIQREHAARVDAEAAQRRLEVLAMISRTFAEAQLELPTIITAIVQQITHLIGDTCTLRLLSDDGATLLPGTTYHLSPDAASLLQQSYSSMPLPSGVGIMGQVAQTGEPLFMPVMNLDALPFPVLSPVLEFMQQVGTHSTMIVPLRVRERISGVLAFSRDMTPTPYSEDDLRLAQELADRAALAIENARLYQAAQDAIRVRESAQRRLQVLATASRAFAETQLDLPMITYTIVQEVATLMGDGCALRLLSDDGATLLPGDSFHRQSASNSMLRRLVAESPLRVGDGLMGQVAATGKALFAPQISSDTLPPEAVPGVAAFIRQAGTHSAIIVPLQTHDQIIGVLVFSRDMTPTPYTESDLEIGQELADRAALAIENARLYQAAQDAIRVRAAAQRRLQVLADASRAFAETQLDLPAVLATIGQSTTTLIGDVCSVRLLSDDGATLLPGAIYHRDEDARAFLQTHFGNLPLDIDGSGIMQRAAQTGEAILMRHVPLDDPNRARSGTDAPHVVRGGAHSRLAVPLRVQDRIIGVFSMSRDMTPTPYSDEDMQLAQELAERAALAIENARLYQAAQDAIRVRESAQRRLQVLADASRAFAEAQLELSAIIQASVRQVATLIGDGCTLRMLSDDRMHLLPGQSFHQDREARAFLQGMVAEPPQRVGDGLTGVVAATGEAIFVPYIRLNQVRALSKPEYLLYVEKFGVHSAIIVALRVHDRILGTLNLVRDVTKTPYSDEDLQLAQDIADRAALAIENARLYQAAQDAIRVREVFLSIAAHELRTPLTSMLGHAARISRQALRDERLAESYRRSLSAINTQGQRLNTLIEELLDVSRLQLGTFSLNLEQVDLGALLRHVVDEMTATLERHTIMLALPDEPLSISADPQRLEQIVYNLLHNAAKYSPQGGTIVAAVDRRSSQAALTVADQGMGIPAAEVPKIFQQFYRASNVDSQQIRGLGIGLYLVQAMVAQHGGTISVDSQEGAGSTFTVLLPIVH